MVLAAADAARLGGLPPEFEALGASPNGFFFQRKYIPAAPHDSQMPGCGPRHEGGGWDAPKWLPRTWETVG